MQGTIGLVLAAGKDDRMNSNKSKLVQKIFGKEIILRTVETLKKSGIEEIAVVVGDKKEDIQNVLKDSVLYIEQNEILGSGYAVMQAKEYLKSKTGRVVIVNADLPLLEAKTVIDLLKQKEQNIILTAIQNTPNEYGRIIRDEIGNLKNIVEEFELDEQKTNIKEVNAGVYCFEIQEVLKALEKLKPAQNNMYNITDIIGIMVKNGITVGAQIVEDSTEVLPINDRIQLEYLSRLLRMKINTYHMKNGVTIEDTNTTTIYEDVQIGQDTVIHPNCTIKSNVVIGNECEIGPNSYIREACCLADNVKIGSFVEIKKAIVGKGSKIPHLSYMGDCQIGEKCNIGCGTITCNYDGFKKSQTIIGNNVFVGSNVNLVAPVEIKDNSFIAAGSTITDDVPANSLAIARERQINKEGWNNKL